MSDELIQRTTRHSALVQQYGRGEITKAQEFLKRIDKKIVLELAKEGQSIATQARLSRLLRYVRGVMDEELGKLTESLLADSEKFARIEAEFERKNLASSLPKGVEVTMPTAEQLHAAIFSRPLQGRFLKDEMALYTQTQRRLIHESITEGYFQGKPTQEIIRSIRGTRALKYKDGIIGGQMNRDTSRIVTTAINHVSNRAKERLWRSNSDIIVGWRFVNTLDSRTSLICASQDTEKVWPMGQGPLPPLHPNCRSTTAAVLNPKLGVSENPGTRPSIGADGVKLVPANQTYSTWMRNQPAKFQDQVLGKTRGALFRRGDLDITKFSDSSNKILTLDELKSLDPLAFDKANLK